MSARFNWIRTKPLHNYIKEYNRECRNAVDREKEAKKRKYKSPFSDAGEYIAKVHVPLPKYTIPINSNTLYTILRKWDYRGKRNVTMELGRRVNLYLDDGKCIRVTITEDQRVEIALFGNNSQVLKINYISVSNGITDYEFIESIENLIRSSLKF